jgi:hypothetical protein
MSSGNAELTLHVRQAYFDGPDLLSDWPIPLFGFDCGNRSLLKFAGDPRRNQTNVGKRDSSPSKLTQAIPSMDAPGRIGWVCIDVHQGHD